MTISLTYKGFNYPAFYNGAYADANSLASLAATGANSVTVGSDYGINAQTATVYADSAHTESLSNLSDTILQAESLGLSVTVRPLIDLVNVNVDGTLTNTWRDTYMPYDTAAFFASYKNMIVNVASIAQADGAQILDIGSELDQLTGPQYQTQWTQIITAVRAVYSGKLTYSATWDDNLSPWIYGDTPGTYTAAPAGTGNIATQISFWNQLDFIGIDEYAPISDVTDPTLQQLIDGWTQPPTDPETAAVTGGKSLISYYESLSVELGKPLLFTEIGYQDATDSARNVITSSTGVADPALQSLLYTAFFDAWQQSGDSSLQGVWAWYWNPNTADEGASNGITFSPQTLPAQQAITAAYSEPATVGSVPCYAGGTYLATPDGETLVEQLRPGDKVRTHSGRLRRIQWIGQRGFDGHEIRGNLDLLPILVTANALADGVPCRDLFVSPDHALLLDDVLVPARLLVNGHSIRQLAGVDQVQYFHVELSSHDILLANGAPAESYLDTGNRHRFTNAASRAATNLASIRDWSEACAQLILSGPKLVSIKQRLFLRGAQHRPIQPSLQVTAGSGADHQILLPDRGTGGEWCFTIPTGVTTLQLRSDPFVPACCIADSLDQRRLGVRLSGIEVDGTAQPLNAAIFSTGFYPCELTAEGSCRWTNGDAVIALDTGARRVVLQLPDPVILPDAVAAEGYQI